MEVLNNQWIEFLGSSVGNLKKWERKWYKRNMGCQEGWVRPMRRRVSNDRYHLIREKRGIQWDRGQIRLP
jgi:hypothetical protein